ncbi:MAG: TolC family protein [Parafilimonas sp.]
MKNFTAVKIYIVLIILIAFYVKGSAQIISNLKNATYNKTDTVPEKSVRKSAIQYSLTTDEDDTIVENRLVQLALAQPNYEATIYQQKIFEYQLKKQRNSWLNLLTLSTSYNDQTFSKSVNTPTTAYVYPKYFFGINIPLGLIVSNGTDVKITKQSALIAEGQQVELAKSIRASVLSNYKQYKASEKLLVFQSQIVDDQEANFLQVEQKFKDGTATLELYNDASKKYNDEQVKVINLQLQQDLIKVELERLIGRKLEDALK